MTSADGPRGPWWPRACLQPCYCHSLPHARRSGQLLIEPVLWRWRWQGPKCLVSAPSPETALPACLSAQAAPWPDSPLPPPPGAPGPPFLPEVPLVWSAPPGFTGSGQAPPPLGRLFGSLSGGHRCPGARPSVLLPSCCGLLSPAVALAGREPGSQVGPVTPAALGVSKSVGPFRSRFCLQGSAPPGRAGGRGRRQLQHCPPGVWMGLWAQRSAVGIKQGGICPAGPGWEAGTLEARL